MTPNAHGVLVGSAREGPSIAGFHKVVTLQRCETEYRYAESLGLKPVDAKPNAAFDVGTFTHHGRAMWFASQCTKHPDDVCQDISDMVRADGNPIKIQAEREAQRLITKYIKHWSLYPKPHVRAVEYQLGPAPLKERDPFFLYRTARLDDVSIYPDALNQLCIGDLKTTSDTISGIVNEYRQSGQFMTYALLWDMAKEGREFFNNTQIPGIMIDIVTKDENPKFHRELLTITEHQKRWWYENMSHLLRRAANITGTTPTSRNTTQCARAISRRGSYLCPFHKLCQYGSSATGQYTFPDGRLMSEEKELVG